MDIKPLSFSTRQTSIQVSTLNGLVAIQLTRQIFIYSVNQRTSQPVSRTGSRSITQPYILSTTKQPTSFGGQPGSHPAGQKPQSEKSTKCLSNQAFSHSVSRPTKAASQPTLLLGSKKKKKKKKMSASNSSHEADGQERRWEKRQKIKINRKENNSSVPEYSSAFIFGASTWYNTHRIHSVSGWLLEMDM